MASKSMLSANSPERKNLEYSHVVSALRPQPLTPLNLGAAALSPFPVVGNAAAIASDVQDYQRGALEPDAVNLALTGLNLVPFGGPMIAGALRGIRRMPPLYHGTIDKADRLISEGFTKGASAELGIPGTSASTDPTVAKGFTPSIGFLDETTADRLVRVRPEYGPEEVANLPPSAYFSGNVPEAPGYKKPNLFFQESEIFTPRPQAGFDSIERTKAPLRAERITPSEALKIDKAADVRREAITTIANLVPEDRTIGPSSVSMREAADALRSIKGNRGAYANGANKLLDFMRRTPAYNNKDLGRVAKEFPDQFKGLQALADSTNDSRVRMMRLRNDVEYYAKQPPHSKNNLGETSADLLRRVGEDLDAEYRNYYRLREAFVSEFENLAYHRESLRKLKKTLDTFGLDSNVSAQAK